MLAGAAPRREPQTCLQRLGIDADEPLDLSQMVAGTECNEMLEAIAAEIDVGDLPLRLWNWIRCAEY